MLKNNYKVLIGGMLDCWDLMNNDLKSEIEFEYPVFVKYINLLIKNKESDTDFVIKRIHVIPIGLNHTDSLNCWCGPAIDPDEPNLIIHYDYDGKTQRHKRTTQDEYS